MGNVIIGTTMSLDGFMNDRNGDLSRLYPHLEELRRTEMLQGEIRTTGAAVMGRRTYDMFGGDVTEYEYQVPIFVLTHAVPEKGTKGENERLTLTFVTDGIESAIEKAKATAGDKHVMVIAGANTAQQCLRTGLVDEIHIGIVPVLFGEGLRFFELSLMSRWNWKKRGCSSPRREPICGSALSSNIRTSSHRPHIFCLDILGAKRCGAPQCNVTILFWPVACMPTSKLTACGAGLRPKI